MWSIATLLVTVLRYTTFADTSIDERFVLLGTYVFATWCPLMIGNAFEQRRLALAAGLRGRGCFGVLRGWLKTASVEITANDEDLSSSEAAREVLRDFAAFRRLVTFVFVSYLVIVPLLLL